MHCNNPHPLCIKETDQLKIPCEVCIPTDQILRLPHEGCFQQFVIAWVTADSQAAAGSDDSGFRLDQSQIEMRLRLTEWPNPLEPGSSEHASKFIKEGGRSHDIEAALAPPIDEASWVPFWVEESGDPDVGVYDCRRRRDFLTSSLARLISSSISGGRSEEGLA